MIRTNTVTLSEIKGVAYRLKLTSGGSGIVIVREDATQPGIASISKTSGEPILTANTSKKLFPPEAFKEAMVLTAGLPYRKQGKATLKDKEKVEEIIVEEQPEEEAVVDSKEYEKIVEQYTDKNGKLSYALLNKDMIKFAHSSSKVRKMLKEGAGVDEVCLYTVGTKFRNITGNPDLADKTVLKMVELLDEVSPKGVFTEFIGELRKAKAAKK